MLAYVAYLPKDRGILVAFRGSDNQLNWAANFKLELKPYLDACNCRVHEGHYQSYLDIKPMLMQQLTNYRSKYPKAKLYVIGHSLGAV